MIVIHQILNKKYLLDNKFNIKNYLQLKKQLVKIIGNIKIDNIKLFKNGNEFDNLENIDTSINEIYMAIVPIKCCIHN